MNPDSKMIKYQNNLDGITSDKLNGFFVGWPNPPTREQLFQILENSYTIVLALDSVKDMVVGFVNALSDKVIYSYIPLLEVLPEYQKKGIGRELIKRIENSLQNMYAIDIVCDDDVSSFYSKLDYFKLNGMVKRNYKILKK